MFICSNLSKHATFSIACRDAPAGAPQGGESQEGKQQGGGVSPVLAAGKKRKIAKPSATRTDSTKEALRQRVHFVYSKLKLYFLYIISHTCISTHAKQRQLVKGGFVDGDQDNMEDELGAEVPADSETAAKTEEESA